MKYIVVDLEMNPISQEYPEERKICKNETIQIGAVCLDNEYNEIANFACYVRPTVNPVIDNRIQNLTHITTAMVQDAPRFGEAVKAFFDWCRSFGDDVQLLQWSKSDYRQFRKEMVLKHYENCQEENYMETPWIDLQEEFGKLVGLSRKQPLSGAVTLMGSDFQGRQHDALSDTRNEAEIMRAMRDPVKRRELVKTVEAALSVTPLVYTLADAFDFSSLKLSA